MFFLCKPHAHHDLPLQGTIYTDLLHKSRLPHSLCLSRSRSVSMRRERKFPRLCQFTNACTLPQIHQKHTYVRALSFDSCPCSVMCCHSRFQIALSITPISFCCHSYYLLFNCLNYSSSLDYSNPYLDASNLEQTNGSQLP